MDTDDLSTETYTGVLIEAENFNHELTSEFGILAIDCQDDDEFLEASLKLIAEFKTFTTDDLNSIFLDNIPDLASFKKLLETITNNINNIRKTPQAKRHYDFEDDDEE